MVQQVKEAGIEDKVVYAIFNEPAGNRFPMIDECPEVFNEAWKEAYELIRKEDPDAMIAGPNFAYYNSKRMENFVKYCGENDCIPDQVTWHALNESLYTYFNGGLESFRALEKKYWLDTKKITKQTEVIINEYSDFTDLGVPGRMAKWIALFEDAKVGACLAF